MAEVRFWRPDDLPHLSYFAAMNTWKILTPDDQAVASIGYVASSAEENLHAVLSSPGGTALVAEENGRPVGYLLIGIRPAERTGEPSGYMADVYIEPEYRNQGIAGQFHKLGEEYLQRLGVRKATLWTHAHNPLGRQSAERQGYRTYGAMYAKKLR